MSASPREFTDADELAEDIIREVGKTIVLGLPLGLGKANHVANALFRRAAADPSISLTIFTALTLEKPRYKNDLERRFLAPVIERLFGDYPELEYAKALRARKMPPNIQVNEFFLLAGAWLGVPEAQQHYISANYTHAMRYVMERGVNVVAQLVSKRVRVVDGRTRYSLSSNTDLTLDLLAARASGAADFKLIAEVNSELPFMPGEGDLPAETFSHVLESKATDFPLFAPPHEPITDTGYAIGLHAARLVSDGGTLQIGIGQEGDAAAQGMILRQKDNAAFREVIARLDGNRPAPALNELGSFEKGLYGMSEMLVASFLELMKAGIVKREIDGKFMHAGFFVGPKAFYRALREMDPAMLSKIEMTAISFTNELYGGEDIKRHARAKARFINNAMMVTLLGAVVSDGLEDGRVVSGVGGQYNFVAQAFALPDARSILTVNAARGVGFKRTSNVRWSYGHTTIPRHLRDIVVSEYGVADLRGKSDEDVIAAMLSIADSRFQPGLLRKAKDAGKLPKNFQIPAYARENTPERIARALSPFRERGLLPPFPFGSDFDAVEQRLIPALQTLQDASSGEPLQLLKILLSGFSEKGESDSDRAALARLGLAQPKTFSDKAYAILVRGALRGAKS
ncbi:MAG TPA: acetyl-CoA hydrolase/transferase C-terminal domain-containing protein [Xanthobacteraceae bacterium]|nr:acetyl-CoA hydrolase/transferase C-terminal domain-containing protein [Xanthobacteraceae bacterium]